MVSRYKFYDEGYGVRSSIIMCVFELGFRPFTSLIFVFRPFGAPFERRFRRPEATKNYHHGLFRWRTERTIGLRKGVRRKILPRLQQSKMPSIAVWRSGIFKLVNQ